MSSKAEEIGNQIADKVTTQVAQYLQQQDQVSGRVNHTLNVRDYGATGNGNTDDGPDIQDAFIDASRSDGKSKVEFPDGKYFVEDTILVPDNVTPVGMGMGNSIIKGALNNEPTLKLDKCKNVRFEGLTFTAEAEPDNSNSWFFFGNGKNIRFHECQWKKLPRQGGLFRGEDYRFSRCRIEDTGRDGLLFASVNRPMVMGCYFLRTGDDSIAFNADTQNGLAVGNIIEESGVHHAGGGVKQHGSNCGIFANTFIRPKTYAIRVQNRDEDGRSTGPWPERIIFNGNIVNGMNEVGGENNSAIEVKTTTGEVLINNLHIYTYDGVSKNRRGMRIQATGPQTRVDISDVTISQNEDANSKYAIVLERDFERIKMKDISFYGTSDGVRKIKGNNRSGDAEIRDCYFDPGEGKQLFDCATDAGFETLRVRGNTSKAPGSVLVNLNDGDFGLVQDNDNLARNQINVSGAQHTDELVKGPL